MAVLQNELLTVEIDERTLALNVTNRRGGMAWRTPGTGFDLQTYDLSNQHCRWYPSQGSDLSKAKYGPRPRWSYFNAIALFHHAQRQHERFPS